MSLKHYRLFFMGLKFTTGLQSCWRGDVSKHELKVHVTH